MVPWFISFLNGHSVSEMDLSQKTHSHFSIHSSFSSGNASSSWLPCRRLSIHWTKRSRWPAGEWLGNPAGKSHMEIPWKRTDHNGGERWGEHMETLSNEMDLYKIYKIDMDWREIRVVMGHEQHTFGKVNALEYVLIPRIEDQDSYHCHKAARAIDESHMFHFFPSNFLTAFGWFGQLRTSSTTSHRRWMSRQDVLSQIVPQAHPEHGELVDQVVLVANYG